MFLFYFLIESLNKGDIISVLYDLYNKKKLQTEALVFCLPKISVISSSTNNGIFEASLPCSRQSTQRDTLPWTITLEDFTIITLSGDALPYYICKPLSCKVFLAASSNKKTKASQSSQVFYEREDSKNQQHSKLLNIGFVIHADWTSCELFLCKSQVKILFT